MLCNLDDPRNVGAAWRLGEIMGAERLLLIGRTPQPPNRKLQRLARGAEKRLPYSSFASLEDCLRAAYDEEPRPFVLGVELASDALALPAAVAKWRGGTERPLLLLVGNEAQGLSPQELGLCDTVAFIPQYGQVSSLNVTSALSMVLWECLREHSIRSDHS